MPGFFWHLAFDLGHACCQHDIRSCDDCAGRWSISSLRKKSNLGEPHHGSPTSSRQDQRSRRAARADCRRLCLFVETPGRSTRASAQRGFGEGEVRRPRRRGGESEADRPLRLRRQRRRIARARQIHAATEARRAGLHVALIFGLRAAASGCPRSDRQICGQRRPHDGSSGRDRPVPPEGMATWAESRARSQSQLSRGIFSGGARRQRCRDEGDGGGDEGQEAAARSGSWTSRSSRNRIRAF